MDTQVMLRRLLKASQDERPKDQMTSGRALRLAIARAAEDTLGLSLTVLGVNQEREPLDSVVKRLAGDWMLVGLWRGGMLVGLAGLELQARAAVTEMQTLGQLRTAPAAGRAITASDVALSVPFVAALLAEIEEASTGTDLVGWAAGVLTGPRVADARAVGLALPEATYRHIEMTLDLGTGERQGTVLLVLPAAPVVVSAPEADSGGKERFSAQFRTTVMEAPAVLHAVLHRMTLPLSTVARFEVGQMLSLPGVTVGSVRIEGPGGQSLGRARLGQVTGLRAVRLEVAGLTKMSEVRLPEHRTGVMQVAGADAAAGPAGTDAPMRPGAPVGRAEPAGEGG